MKRSILFSTILTTLFLNSLAQKELSTPEMQTLFKKEKAVGAYLGINTKYSNINNTETLLTGGELSLVIGRKFNFGLEGYGLVNPIKMEPITTEDENTYLNLGYGGFHLEPVLFSKKLIHINFPILLGAGGMAQTKKSYLNEDFHDTDFSSNDLVSTDFFMVAEPGVMLELNLFRFMRLGAGVSHRFVGGIDTPKISNHALSGWAGEMSLRLGWF